MRLGWLARMPGPSIDRMTGIGIGIVAASAPGSSGSASPIPMSGAVLLGGALVLGGVGTFVFGRAMSQRTDERRVRRRDAHGLPPDAAEDDGAGAQSMSEVVEQPEIATLADTPGQGGRVGHGARPARRGGGASWPAGSRSSARRPAHRPARTTRCGSGSQPGSAWSGASAAEWRRRQLRLGQRASPVPRMPDIGGMFDALGSVGSLAALQLIEQRQRRRRLSVVAGAGAAGAGPARFKRRWRRI